MPSSVCIQHTWSKDTKFSQTVGKGIISNFMSKRGNYVFEGDLKKSNHGLLLTYCQISGLRINIKASFFSIIWEFSY